MLTQEQINSAHARGFNYFEQEIEKLTNKSVNESMFVIFGVTPMGERLEFVLKKKVAGYCDNDIAKQGGKVYAVEEAVNKFPFAIFLLTQKLSRPQCAEQLVALGVSCERIINNIPIDLIVNISNFMTAIRVQDEFPERKRPYHISVGIVNHCNLNCKGCLSFSPLAKAGFYGLENFKRDLERLFVICPDMDYLTLYGGEVLLCENIDEYLEFARRVYTNTKIKILTNGLLFLSRGERLFNSLSQNNIVVAMTEYPINNNVDQIKQICDAYGITFESVGKVNDFINWNFNPKGNSPIVDSFCNCFAKQNCLYLYDSKLWNCPQAAVGPRLDSYFGTSFFERSNSDYCDIYSVNSFDELKQKLREPIPFCRFCNPIKHSIFPWGRTSYKLSEFAQSLSEMEAVDA